MRKVSHVNVGKYVYCKKKQIKKNRFAKYRAIIQISKTDLTEYQIGHVFKLFNIKISAV